MALVLRGHRVPPLAVAAITVIVSTALGVITNVLGLTVLATLFALVLLGALAATGVLLLKWLFGELSRGRQRVARVTAERRRPTPYAFHPPAGWPQPALDWLPLPGWEPQPDWPRLPQGWPLWQRVTPRPPWPVQPQRSVWDAQEPAAARVSEVLALDEQRLRERAAHPDGRRELLGKLVAYQRLGLSETLEHLEEHVAGDRGRSMWHPLEWAYAHAGQALAASARTLHEQLAEGQSASMDEFVTLWRGTLAWLDEFIEAARERAGGTPYGPVTVGARRSSTAALSGADWQQAEQLAAAALRRFGFDDARVTGDGNDRGLDVVGSTIAAQVKYTGSPVGRPVIQQLLGAAGHRQAAFFSRAGFSAHAVTEADARGVALFRITLPTSVSAVNAAAKRLTTH